MFAKRRDQIHEFIKTKYRPDRPSPHFVKAPSVRYIVLVFSGEATQVFPMFEVVPDARRSEEPHVRAQRTVAVQMSHLQPRLQQAHQFEESHAPPPGQMLQQEVHQVDPRLVTECELVRVPWGILRVADVDVTCHCWSDMRVDMRMTDTQVPSARVAIDSGIRESALVQGRDKFSRGLLRFLSIHCGHLV